jgi:tRNA(Ile2) C34 agmatinyltransferase TiaS
LKRAAKLLAPVDRNIAFGGIRRGTKRHPTILNMEKFELLSAPGRGNLLKGIYISSPRANRHLTKPLIRYGRDDHSTPRLLDGWLEPAATRPLVLA